MNLAPNVNYQISNLRDSAHWLPVIAQWHHDEWLKHQSISGRAHSSEEALDRLRQRRDSLSLHLKSTGLPSTFVAHVLGEPIGSVSLVYYQFTKDNHATEWLTNLFVLPEFRKQGVAQSLLSLALEHAMEMKVPKLMLYTSDSADYYRKRHWRTINHGIVQGQKVEIMDYQLS